MGNFAGLGITHELEREWFERGAHNGINLIAVGMEELEGMKELGIGESVCIGRYGTGSGIHVEKSLREQE